jgi:hypothetical protein
VGGHFAAVWYCELRPTADCRQDMAQVSVPGSEKHWQNEMVSFRTAGGATSHTTTE